MNAEQIEAEALDLSEKDRAMLAKKLLLSLDSQTEDEITASWVEEAYRRAEDFKSGKVQPVSADEVRRKAKALLK